MRLPAVLSAVDIPAPELRAARLDGEVFAVGDCFSPVDEIEQPRHRAAAAHAGHSARLIAEQLSAAWVWGALDSPPPQHQFCVATGARVSHSPGRGILVREVVIGTDEVVALGRALVTTPARTVMDLVRFAERFGADEARAVNRLAAGAGLSLGDAARAISGRRNLPNKRRAVARLELCARIALPAAEPLPAE
jgi:hypothetical protein